MEHTPFLEAYSEDPAFEVAVCPWAIPLSTVALWFLLSIKLLFAKKIIHTTPIKNKTPPKAFQIDVSILYAFPSLSRSIVFVST